VGVRESQKHFSRTKKNSEFLGEKGRRAKVAKGRTREIVEL